MSHPMNPSPALLTKLGSIIVHSEELNSPNGHAFDKVTLDQLLADPDVVAWREAMDKAGFLPKKRR